ncbi:MAG: hypothetical protein ACRCY5_06605 [Phocaeicola sp.]
MNKISTILLSFCTSVVLVACSNSDSNTADPIYGYFDGEKRPEKDVNCFDGAYYRKCLTSKDVWSGITGTVVLPTITFDSLRKDPAKPGQYLDNPSVYMGGNASGQETDIGLTWEVVKLPDGSISKEKRAFRPFLRRTAFLETGQEALYENAPAEAAYYWYEGEQVTLTLKVNANRMLLFTVEGAGKKFERAFQCDGYTSTALIDFKRVNAIDQVRNEGKPAQPTQTKVAGSKWISTSLYRKVDGQELLVPMHSGRFTDMRCPDNVYFVIDATDAEAKEGGETILIDGGGSALNSCYP